MRVVLFGDGESPHLLKWARALAPRVELHVASSRGLAPALAELVAPERTLALGHATRFSGGNAALLRTLPRLVRWLRKVDADWINAHYLSSHGTLAWLARRAGVRAQLAASAWGSDILVAPAHSRVLRWLTTRVLRDAAVCTSDSAHMAQRMRELGAREVMTFPFGLDALPPAPAAKEPRLFFANRGLEEIYQPQRVLALSEIDLDSLLALKLKPVGATNGRGQSGMPHYLGNAVSGIAGVGSFGSPVLDLVIGAQPDLILVGSLPDPELLAQLSKITSFDAGGMIGPTNPGGKVPGVCDVIAGVKNGGFVRLAPTTGFECKGTFVPLAASS